MADAPRCKHAGVWRAVREVLGQTQCAIQVTKVKAHRHVSQVSAEDMEDFVGNELADKLAKQGASDRVEVQADAADAALRSNLAKARKVVSALAQQVWPDSESMGRAWVERQAAHKDGTGHYRSHRWLWYAGKWCCRVCGRLSKMGKFSRCPGARELKGVHESHSLWLARQSGTAVFF